MTDLSNEKSSLHGAGLFSNQQANDIRSLTESSQKSSVFTLVASDGGWRFKLPGTMEVELMTEEGKGPLVPLSRCRVGQRVLHLGRVHRIFEIATDGMTRRLIHKTPERTP